MLLASLRATARILTLLSLSLPSWSQTAEPPLLTLKEAVDEALSNSERIIETRDSLQQARLSVNLARSYFSPKIVPNVLGSFGQTDQANQTYQMTLSKRFITGTEIQANLATTSLRNQLGNFWNTDTTFSLRQPILRGMGRSVTGRDLLRSELSVVEAERRQVLAERELAVQVAAAYYRIASQARLVEVSDKALQRTMGLVEASKAKLQAGRVSQLDVFRAEQLAAETEGQLLDSRAALEDAKDLLRDFIEIGHDYDFRVETEFPLPMDGMSVEEAGRIALDNSLEVQIVRDNVLESERTVAFAKNQMLPRLDLGVAALRGKTSESLSSTFGTDDYEVATFIAASAPVDRTPELIAFNNALIERDRRRRDVSRVERRTASAARRAARALERLDRTYELAKSKVDFAASEVEVATLRYQRGLANNLDVVNAELGLLGAQSRMFSILAELAVARLQLRATLGILKPREDI